MVVKAKPELRRMTGLHVGDTDVRQLFPPEVSYVELELDHLRIVCNLEPGFWDGDGAIHDERLVSWLESKRMSGKLGEKPAPLAMIPAGDHAFRLQPLRSNEVRTSEYPVGFCA